MAKKQDEETPAMAAIAPQGGPLREGYEVRQIAFPAHYWQRFDQLAARAGISTSEWLERYLRMAAK